MAVDYTFFASRDVMLTL